MRARTMNCRIKQYLPILVLCIAMFGACADHTLLRQEADSNEYPRQEIDSHTFIQISTEGGGLYGGANPVTEDKKVIENDGRILISYKQLYTGDRSETLFVSRDEVEELVGFIRDNGFLNMRDVYDCNASDKKCRDRKKKYPPAVPLKIDVIIGDSEKVVTVTVYEKGMVDYPEKLEAIVDKITEVISQAEE